MEQKSPIRIEGDRIYLKKLREDNATQEYCDWLNDSEVNIYLETKRATIEELKRYIRERENNKNCLFLGIFLKENNKHVGNIKLEPIDLSCKKTTLGILIGDKNYWGRGIGTEATKLVVNHAFNTLGLNDVNLGVISKNKSAIRVYEKVGFEVDKIEKKSDKYGGSYYGITMSINKNNKN